MPPKPGEVYWAELGEIRKRIIILSREELNRGEYVVAVPTTSARLDERWEARNCAPFEGGAFCFSGKCVAQGEMITFLDKTVVDLDNGPIATLDEEALRNVVRAVGYAIGANCEPDE